MEKRLFEVFSGRGENYLLPFFWQHGDHREKLAGQIESIYQSGAGGFCVESRTHEDFCGSDWWADMETILNEAKKRDMKVWILDDKHFPTGYANGIIPKKYPHLRKWFLREEHVDVMGQMSSTTLLLGKTEDILLGVYAYERSGVDEEITGEPICLTDNVKGNWLCFDIPKGCWRVFFLYKSRNGGSSRQDTYIDMLNPESVHALIEAVYEPHYEHFKDMFSNTIAGFFSDEPSLGNALGGTWTVDYGMYNRRLGMAGLALPWGDALFSQFEKALKVSDGLSLLPLLWYSDISRFQEVRLAYMDKLTALYRDSFTNQLGNWCRDHNVQYIGHVIEDMNAHARLGCSTGHYFRSLDGQDMSGIDVVLHQIIPGFSEYKTSASCAGGVTDPEFFHYVLAQLGASLSHINPKMQGRAMCEVFGAYGWAEGTPMMKWLMDFLLVRGINHFVPHGFSPSFPDPDCPPHFYAEGNDPQFAGFTALMRYVNKVSHLLSDSVHKADVAVLYHAEGEWMNKDCMLMQKPAKLLCDNHIGYDILPIDTVCGQTAVSDGKLVVGKESYNCLIIPYAKRLPEYFLEQVKKLSIESAEIIFIDAMPENIKFNGRVIPLDKLVETLHTRDMVSVRIKNAPQVRVYHTKRSNTDFFMLFNESVTTAFDTQATLPCKGDYLRLDFLSDKYCKDSTDDGEIALKLEPYQSLILVFGDIEGFSSNTDVFYEKEKLSLIATIESGFKISLCEMGIDKDFWEYRKDSGLINITSTDNLPEFSGLIRYECVFEATQNTPVLLDLGEVGQTAQVRLNGTDMGIKICPPYTYYIGDFVRSGENILTITVANTLVHRIQDYFSHYLQIPPSGLLGPVRIYTKNK